MRERAIASYHACELGTPRATTMNASTAKPSEKCAGASPARPAAVTRPGRRRGAAAYGACCPHVACGEPGCHAVGGGNAPWKPQAGQTGTVPGVSGTMVEQFGQATDAIAGPGGGARISVPC